MLIYWMAFPLCVLKASIVRGYCNLVRISILVVSNKRHTSKLFKLPSNNSLPLFFGDICENIRI